MTSLAQSLDGASGSLTPAIVISTCALLFTVGSFWWLYVRPGRLRMVEIRVFAAYVHADEAALRIPVTLYNSGPKPLVVVDLRLQMSSAGHAATAATRVFRTTIKPSSDDVEDFPHPYVVPGRSVVTKFVDFAADPSVMTTGESATAGLLVLISGRGWRKVGGSEIRTDVISSPDAYISYSNDPAHWPTGQLDKARSALVSVRSRITPTE